LHSTLSHKPNAKVTTSVEKHQQNITKRAPTNTNKTHQGGANKHQYNTRMCLRTIRGQSGAPKDCNKRAPQTSTKCGKGAPINNNRTKQRSINKHQQITKKEF
jgi:hypothetical protein